MGFFSKKNQIESQSPITEQNNLASDTTRSKLDRKYFEIFGDTIAELNFFKTLCLILVALSIFLVTVLKITITKPPLVIRVDSVGQAEAVQNIRLSLKVSEPEVSNFTQHFLQYFTAHNFYTYDDDFHRAFTMMTTECKKKLNHYLNTNRTVENIKNDQLKTKLTITEIVIEKEGDKFINLKVKGYKEVESYLKPEIQQKIIFENLLTLNKSERTMHVPWGLLVEEWREIVYKVE